MKMVRSMSQLTPLIPMTQRSLAPHGVKVMAVHAVRRALTQKTSPIFTPYVTPRTPSARGPVRVRSLLQSRSAVPVERGAFPARAVKSLRGQMRIATVFALTVP